MSDGIPRSELVTGASPAGWIIPAGWQWISLAVCRGCGRGIAWARTLNGRSAPLDRDGISHFATCPDAARFRRRTMPPSR